MDNPGEPTTLEEAKQVIGLQEEELRRLRQQVEDDRFAEDLRDVLVLTAANGIIASPVDHERLLEMIVSTAAHVIGAEAGLLFVVDEAKGELCFEVSMAPNTDAVEKFRVPLGHGIAGLVAATGQPMATSAAEEDQRLLEEVGEMIGYEPRSLMAVPLSYGDRVIGVLELLDKDAARSFSPSDMEALAMFGHQAAVALELSRTYRHLAPLVGEIIASVDDRHGERKLALRKRSDAFARHIEDDPSYAETLELAELVQLIAWEGDDELVACRTILRAFADYLRSRPALLSGGRKL